MDVLPFFWSLSPVQHETDKIIFARGLFLECFINSLGWNRSVALCLSFICHPRILGNAPRKCTSRNGWVGLKSQILFRLLLYIATIANMTGTRCVDYNSQGSVNLKRLWFMTSAVSIIVPIRLYPHDLQQSDFWTPYEDETRVNFMTVDTSIFFRTCPVCLSPRQP